SPRSKTRFSELTTHRRRQHMMIRTCSRFAIYLTLIVTFIGLTIAGCRQTSPSPPAATAVLCIELAPDGGSLFVSHGPCGRPGGGGSGGGGGAGSRVDACRAKLEA